ncbi:transcriptional regulator, TetR family [Jatrophihabitans endophyticus]|uniref:Transcriptional regulator, TetR family n=1 Tax=Jatrophihabitans endophyticus TaxID=1206085 RepID=A0A1M5C185_9ACTN|nr:TetR/AcrR family transcriptional regulator [Jatrophihabitans endophyticus]SHF48523.1 transcriptional regulator, TetR family [Jatrophihabitans endophyticus]
MPYRRTAAVQARLDAQHERIIAAAAALLAEHGYASCTVAAVAARTGIATGTVYNHFASKADLAAAVFRTVVTREVEVVRAAARAHDDVAGQLTAIVETFAGRALKQPRRAYALLAEPVDACVESLRLDFRRAFRDVIAEAVADGVRSGRLPPQNADVVAAALVGAVAEALVGPLAVGHDDPDTLPTLVRFAHRAVGGTPS